MIQGDSAQAQMDRVRARRTEEPTPTVLVQDPGTGRMVYFSRPFLRRHSVAVVAYREWVTVSSRKMDRLLSA